MKLKELIILLETSINTETENMRFNVLSAIKNHINQLRSQEYENRKKAFYSKNKKQKDTRTKRVYTNV